MWVDDCGDVTLAHDGLFTDLTPQDSMKFRPVNRYIEINMQGFTLHKNPMLEAATGAALQNMVLQSYYH